MRHSRHWDYQSNAQQQQQHEASAAHSRSVRLGKNSRNATTPDIGVQCGIDSWYRHGTVTDTRTASETTVTLTTNRQVEDAVEPDGEESARKASSLGWNKGTGRSMLTQNATATVQPRTHRAANPRCCDHASSQCYESTVCWQLRAGRCHTSPTGRCGRRQKRSRTTQP